MTGVLLVLLALFTVAARLGLPLLSSQKSAIEVRISEHLQSPVEIGELSFSWKGFSPLLKASDVSLIESDKRAVSFDEALIDFDLPASISRRTAIISELSLVGSDLLIDSDDIQQFQGRSTKPVVGDSTADAPSAGEDKANNNIDVLALLSNARKVSLLDTRLTLIGSEYKQGFIFDDIDILVEKQGQTHQILLDARLPEMIGGSVSAEIDLIAETDKLAISDGDMHLSVSDVGWSGLNKALSQSGLQSLHELLGESAPEIDAMADLELWGRWEMGELISLRGPLSVTVLSDHGGAHDPIDSVTAELAYAHSDTSAELVVADTRIRQGSKELIFDEIRLTGSTGRYFPWQLDATADELPVDMILHVLNSGLLPLSAGLSDALSASEADGMIETVQIGVKDINLRSPRDAIFTASADINAVSFATRDGALEVGPVNGNFTLNNNIAELDLSATDMPLIVAELSDMGLNVDLISTATTIDFSRQQEIRIASEIHLTDQGIDTNTRLNATFSVGKSPHLDIQSGFSVDDLEAIKAWVPRNKLNARAVAWIDRSIKSGSATQGSLMFLGHINDFPFSDGEGVFNASVQLNDGVLEFLPSWPEISEINGTLELDGLSLTAEANSSVFEKFSLSRTRAQINNIAAPVLKLSSTGSGLFDDAVAFGINGPLSFILEPVIRDMSTTGSTEMDLELVVPLYPKPAEDDVGLYDKTWQPFSVDGSLFLNGNDVAFGRAGLTLTGARGGVAFNRQGIAISTLKGQLLGHDVIVTGETEGVGENATTTINVTGAMAANNLLAHYENTLDQFVRGTSKWDFSLRAPHSAARIASEGVSLSVSSDLLGTSLLLPRPLNKGSALERDFRLTTAFGLDQDQQWQISYADELRTFVSIREQSLYSLLIELGDTQIADRTLALNEAGIRVEGETELLAVRGWIQTVAQYINSLPSTQGGSQPILPVSGSISTNALILGNTNFGNASFRASTSDSYLDVIVSNQSLIGKLQYPRAHWKKDLALQARIELLDWSIIEALGDAENSDEFLSDESPGLDPRMLPPVDASVASLTRDDFHMQDLVLRAEPDISGLDITTLGFAYDTMRLVGQGFWHLRDPQGVNPGLAGQHITQLDLVLQSNDFGAGLSRLGLDGVIDEGQGSIEIKLGWPAPIYLPATAELDGEININLQSGSIVPLEPGAGRVVGLFAFQALPRRLDLDFKDLTGDGLAFRSIAGSIDIIEGIAQVPLLQLTGPIGVVDVVGISDLTTQQFDQVVTVLPRVSAALPIIGAITGGASAGIGTLVATGVLKAFGVDFDRIGLRTYSLTGEWSSPQFAPVPSDFLRLSQ